MERAWVIIVSLFVFGIILIKMRILVPNFILFSATDYEEHIIGQDLQAYVEEVGSNSTIRIAGSTTVSPLMRQLRLHYEDKNKGTRIEVQDIGTSAGIMATLEGVSHIAMSSRNFSKQEIEQGLNSMLFALDGIAIIVHPDNNIDNLTLEQINQIFRGDITNWNEVGGNNAKIIVVSREEGSGIRSSFEELANLQDDIYINGRHFRDSTIARNAIFEKGTGSVIGSVRTSVNAIGYVTTGVLDGTIKDIKIDGVAFSEEAVRDGSYIFTNEFFIATTENTSRNVQDFIDFIFSDEGQSLINEKGYISIR